MNIIVIGAGTVGASIAELLASQGHNLTIMDLNMERLRELGERLDLSTLPGSGASPALLWMAGVDDSDLVMAMTNKDEVNLVAAQLARRLGAKRCVARVKKHEYVKPHGTFSLAREFGIDLIVSPEQLTAAEIANHLADPDAPALGQFAQDQVQLRRLVLEPDSPFTGRSVKELNLPRGLLLMLIVRGEQIIIPRGSSRLEPGDKVSFLGMNDVFKKESGTFGEERGAQFQRVLMAGGGETGLYLATMLERRNMTVKLVDINLQRCEELSETLNKTEIINGDVTDRRFMEEERISAFDAFIAVTGDEETNIMSSLLARELGVKHCICKVDRPDYGEVIQRLGIDLALSPRIVTAAKVLRLLKGSGMKALSLLEEGRVEVVELEVLDKTPIIRAPLSELLLPGDCLIGMIVRGGKVKLPRGSDQIVPGDSVILIAKTEVMDKVEEMFTPEV